MKISTTYLILVFSSLAVFSQNLQAANKYLIFIPGYYGTTFYEKNSGRKIWLKGSQTIIGDNDTTLSMSIPGVRVPEALDLVPGEILDEVSVLGYEYMAYGKTQNYLREIAAKKGYIYDVLAYDWRKDPMVGIKALDQKLAKLRTSPEDEFHIVAHSLGSVIVAYYMRYGAVEYDQAQENWSGLKNLNKVVLVAAPFKGTMIAFKTMFTGLPRGLNRDLLSSRAFTTLESSYFMLPPVGYDLAYDKDLNPVSLGLHNPENWKKNQWGLFYKKNKFGRESIQARTAFTENMIRKGKLFQELLNAPVQVPVEPIPLLYIKGYGLNTVNKTIWIDPIKRPDFFAYGISVLRRYLPNLDRDFFKSDGDGSLPDFSTEPAPMMDALRANVLRNPMEHLEVLHAESSKNQIQRFFE